MSKAEYQGLASAIEREGVRIPVQVLPDGRIVDGAHRWRISEGKAPIEVLNLPEREAFELGIRLNLLRRHMAPQQVDDVVRSLRKEGYSQQKVADLLGYNQRTIGRAEERTNRQTPNVSRDLRVRIPLRHHMQIYERRKTGESAKSIAADYKVSTRAIEKVIAKTEKRLARPAPSPVGGDTAGALRIHLEDFRNAKLDGSIDCILTDPPYRDIQSFIDLGKVAYRCLKPGGWLVTYAGQAWLQEELAALSETLTYHWTAALLLGPEQTMLHDKKIFSLWKPVLVFYKEPRPAFPAFRDVIQGSGREKTVHPMSQNPTDFEKLLTIFTQAGQRIMEPFAGGGAVLDACQKLGRACDAYEIDAVTQALLREKWPDATC